MTLSIIVSVLFSSHNDRFVSVEFIAMAFLFTLNILYQIKFRKINQQLSELKEKSNVLNEILSQKEQELQELQKTNIALNQRYKKEIEKKNAEIRSIKSERWHSLNEKFKISPIYKKAHNISRKVAPGSTRSPFTGADWKALIKTIHDICPPFRLLMDTTYDHLSKIEKECCYLSFLDLDTTAKAILLNNTIENIKKRHYRLKQKLGITGEGISIKEFLIQQILSIL